MSTSATYLANASARVLRMFQRYAQNIKPDDESFLIFISNYLAEQHVKDPKLLPYSQLYKLIKGGIREYIRIQERDRQSGN